MMLCSVMVSAYILFQFDEWLFVCLCCPIVVLLCPDLSACRFIVRMPRPLLILFDNAFSAPVRYASHGAREMEGPTIYS